MASNAMATSTENRPLSTKSPLKRYMLSFAGSPNVFMMFSKSQYWPWTSPTTWSVEKVGTLSCTRLSWSAKIAEASLRISTTSSVAGSMRCFILAMSDMTLARVIRPSSPTTCGAQYFQPNGDPSASPGAEPPGAKGAAAAVAIVGAGEAREKGAVFLALLPFSAERIDFTSATKASAKTFMSNLLAARVAEDMASSAAFRRFLIKGGFRKLFASRASTQASLM
mmetsp:Transcript_33205/g.89936  ORF Transcript_33205/g.89936 Transcript_33205/m.89936 type:complete len:224 (+) Transcript_33205:735-1406(+)